ncbi:MAG: OmpH family outer membrane protein [Robiginitomaculum sp.]|nr:OmpH family outer membrane protein [Robiginitomaculum sp.]
MKFFKSLSALTALILTSIVFSSTALAQSTVLVVDQARVIRESDVGKHIKRQLQSIGKQMGVEMKSDYSPLTSERDRLVKELKGMDMAALKSRPDLQKRAATLKQKVEKSQLEEAYKQKELQFTEQKALQKVNAKLTTILEALVKERNADVLLDRSLVIYSGKSVDVTSTVISRLNSQMRTVSVIRERLPRKPFPGGQK